MNSIQTHMWQFQIWKDRCENVPDWMVAEHPFGNPETKERNGQEVSATSMRHGYTAQRILGFMEKPPLCMLEIGSGFGGLMRVLARAWPAAKVFLADAPPMLEMQKRYLAETVNAKAHTFEGQPVDLVINNNSFGEMTSAEVGQHFGAIKSCLNENGALYTTNRLERDLDFKDYPYDQFWRHHVEHFCGARGWVECFSVRDFKADSPHPATMLTSDLTT